MADDHDPTRTSQMGETEATLDGPIRDSTSEQEVTPVDDSNQDLLSVVPNDVICNDLLHFSKDNVPKGMTASQWRGILRKKRKEIRKKNALIYRKEKDKKRKERKKLERKETESKRLAGDQSFSSPKAKKRKMSDENASKLRIAIDLNYEDLMSEKDLKKVMHQCQRCYAVNRRAESPLQLFFTSFSDKTMDIWDKQFPNYRNWDVHRKKEGYIELFGKENVIFLTSDSPNILNDLDPDKVYIIGGLVDHNHHKGYCFKRALEFGIDHAQLPISQYIKLNSRTVLTINHVFEILLEFSTSEDWEMAFYKAIPSRKVVAPSSSEETTRNVVAPSSSEETTKASEDRLKHKENEKILCLERKENIKEGKKVDSIDNENDD